jgi:drug/metabolite transporter (DMT)-like permease
MAAMNGLWVVFTLFAATGQTARNAMQRELTAALGAAGATHVRFLFGLPFALVFLTAVCVALDRLPPHPPLAFWPAVVAGALTQIAATALMLMTMEQRSFVVSIAYIKTEPILVAILGYVLLRDLVTPAVAAAILIATLGVVLISWRPGAVGGLRAALLGIASAAMFALSSIGYRGAILALHDRSYVMAATVALTTGLVIQAIILSSYLAWREPGVLGRIVRHWRPSLFAGVMGAVASEFWFLAFALATAASVRTLGLVEVLMAQFVTHVVFRQKTSALEVIGIVLVTGGAVLLIWAHH